MESDNRSWADRFRAQGEKWADLHNAAQLLDDMKGVVFAQKVNALLANDPKMAVNRAENEIKSSDDWEEYVRSCVAASHQDNLAKIELEFMKMKLQEYQGQQANELQELKMTMGGG